MEEMEKWLACDLRCKNASQAYYLSEQLQDEDFQW